jgi:sigma-B regulation protein RsbU (phosphoserine phosphatase)
LGGIHRYALGGLTVVPCTIATILAGLIGGGLYLWKRGRPVRVGEAVLVMVVITLLHVRVIAPAILGVSSEVTVILDAALVPMLLVNGAGIAVFFFMISNLRRERKTEADKQRMDSELRLAREIQMAMIPASTLTEDPRYAVHAVLKPAREVGGDLYNVFALDGDRLVLAIGDVAGKGVPASLHMAMTQKLLKALARNDESPASLLGRLNRELCEGNETMTFVTLFVAFCNVQTGEVVFSNGGHNPPYGIFRGGVEPLRLDPGLALGIREQAVYTDQRIRLLPGEVLFLYTDGVTEAMNDREALFGDERLQAGLCRLRDGTPESICRGILDDLAQFVGQQMQSDDITMIALGLTDRQRAQGAGAETAQTGGST